MTEENIEKRERNEMVAFHLAGSFVYSFYFFLFHILPFFPFCIQFPSRSIFIFLFVLLLLLLFRNVQLTIVNAGIVAIRIVRIFYVLYSFREKKLLFIHVSCTCVNRRHLCLYCITVAVCFT